MLKKTLLVSLLLIFFVSDLCAQWEWLNPKPSGYSCSKIHFIDTLNGFVMNANGDLFATNDQGANWKLKKNFPNALTLSMKDSVAVVTGYLGTFYISRDYGNTWTKKSTGVTDYFFAVDVVGGDTVFIATTNGKILSTTDGGNTWQTFNCGIQINSIEFINSMVGFVGGSSYYILKTINGGATWQQVVSTNISPSNTTAIFFKDKNTGIAFRQHSEILRTNDGGTTWTKSNAMDDFFAFHFVNDSLWYACGEYGVFYRTTNGGNSWTYMNPGPRIYDYDLNSTYFINANTGFAVGRRGRILKTTDGGVNWQGHSPTYLDVGDMAIPTKNTAYALVGKNIYKTIDSGKVWQQLGLTVGTGYAEYDVFEKCYFFNADTGLATASEPARVYKTFDGGVSWTQATQYSYDHITDLQFLDGNTGYMAITFSNGGIIVKTTDKGNTWSQVWTSQYYGEVFHKVHFQSSTKGFASRGNSLYITQNGGGSWSLLWQADQITSIWFATNQIGFVTGENSLLRRTTDGGITWTQISVPGLYYYDDIYTVRFLDDQVGYFTSEGGGIYKTIDGGLTWKPWGKASFYRMNSVRFGPGTSVYACGEYGAILRSDIREMKLQSFNASANVCSVVLTVSVTSLFGTADSIQFEYGINDYDHVALATPSSLYGSHPNVNATLNNLLPSNTYKVRLKWFFDGTPYYVDLTNFQSPSLPYITVLSGNVLASSVNSGNQWYLNGSAIQGATGATYTATVSGTYSVQVTETNCSATSAPFQHYITSLSAAPFEQKMMIGPNPVNNRLIVDYTGNPGSFLLLLTDISGRQMLQQRFTKSTVIEMHSLASGVYIAEVINESTKEKVKKRIVKN
jgi:photosystem II stability/assembly factor-like uncharacterized protein